MCYIWENELNQFKPTSMHAFKSVCVFVCVRVFLEVAIICSVKSNRGPWQACHYVPTRKSGPSAGKVWLTSRRKNTEHAAKRSENTHTALHGISNYFLGCKTGPLRLKCLFLSAEEAVQSQAKRLCDGELVAKNILQHYGDANRPWDLGVYFPQKMDIDMQNQISEKHGINITKVRSNFPLRWSNDLLAFPAFCIVCVLDLFPVWVFFHWYAGY